MVEWTENIDKAIAGYDPQSIVLVAPPDADLIRKKVNENLLMDTLDMGNGSKDMKFLKNWGNVGDQYR